MYVDSQIEPALLEASSLIRQFFFKFIQHIGE